MSNEREKYRKLSVEERIELTAKIFIMHPSFEKCFKTIEECYYHSKISKEPLCALITGEPGVGKSTLCEKYEEAHPRIETEEKTIIPVLVSEIPIPTTAKNMVTALLLALGDPLADKGTTYSKTLRLFRLLRECETGIIIIDEFHHIIDKDSKKILYTVSDWLKQLITKTELPLILVGLPHSVKILEANSQLKRRFAMRDELINFIWITKSKNSGSTDKNVTGHDYRAFLKTLDEVLPLAEDSHLAGKSIAYRMWKATNGNVNRTMKLVHYATKLALKSNIEKITVRELNMAFEKLFSEDSAQNPFTISD